MSDSIQRLLELTKPLMNQSDQIQGPGGNTSYKNASGEMFIKASGFRFDEMSEDKGISAVSYLNIRNYFNEVKATDKVKDEAEMLQLISQTILKKTSGESYPKPSMETGFHAVLDTYVIHTHSVWTNLINCRRDKSILIKQLRETFNLVEIPFVSPGFGLSYMVTKAVKEAKENGTKAPDLFLLHNHGVIAHAEHLQSCQDLLVQLDKAIQNLCQISGDYPSTGLKNHGAAWVPDSDFVNTLLNLYQCDAAFFNQVIFPDQTVFFNDQIGASGSNKKIHIDNFSISYHCPERDARAIHETMTAYMFIYHTLVASNTDIDFIGSNEISYINNMEMEKHRKSIQ